MKIGFLTLGLVLAFSLITDSHALLVIPQEMDPEACNAPRINAAPCGRWYSLDVPAPAPVPDSWVLNGVNFETASAKILPESISILDANVAVLKSHPKLNVVIEGHTDSRGSDAYNQKLSEARAQSVMTYFTSQGIDASRLTAVGKGEASPIADNTSQDGMYKNRRIELHTR